MWTDYGWPHKSRSNLDIDIVPQESAPYDDLVMSVFGCVRWEMYCTEQRVFHQCGVRLGSAELFGRLLCETRRSRKTAIFV